jgi:hypothetical protein
MGNDKIATCVECAELFHWCAFSGGYQVGKVPECASHLNALKRMKVEAILVLARCVPQRQLVKKVKFELLPEFIQE